MRLFILFIIKLYQVLVSPFFAMFFPTAGCRSYPSCSVYAYSSIERYGVARGLKKSFLRILKCNPWA